MNFVLPLQRDGEPMFRQIYAGLRDAVLTGKLASGERLPSSRELADQLHVSRTVVLLAYDQLLAEGYVNGRRGAGTYVAPDLKLKPTPAREQTARFHLSTFGRRAAESVVLVEYPKRRKRNVRYDFAYGRSNLELFPFEAWRRILLRNARSSPVPDHDYISTAGLPDLQEAIAAHLKRSRAVVCEPSQVIIVNGSQQALDLITRVLVEANDAVAIEDPGYQGMREVLRVAGARILPVPVDREGIEVSKIPAGARMAFVTPSHQFPTGAVLPLTRRLELLEWAKRHHAVIVEDDYDGEFRYGGQALESLQGLDREGRVIYTGTFSRTIFSALRIGYMIAPKGLVPALTAAKWLSDRHRASLEQQALAEFIANGMYERHLRRLRRGTAQRRDALLESIERVFGEEGEVTGEGAGAHVVLWPKRRIEESVVIARAAERGVGVYGLTGYFLDAPKRSGIILGYARLRDTEIREGIKRLRGMFDR